MIELLGKRLFPEEYSFCSQNRLQNSSIKLKDLPEFVVSIAQSVNLTPSKSTVPTRKINWLEGAYFANLSKGRCALNLDIAS